MVRILLAAVALGVLSLLAPRPALAQGEEQTLVDRSTLALQDMMNQTVSQDPRDVLSHARAVMICPRVFKAGFIFGGEGGACVLLARAGNGTWSYPAFYGMGSGSFGLQIGIEDSQLLMLIMTEKGLVERDETKRPQIYRTRHSQQQTQRQLLGDLLHRAFGGSVKALVLQAMATKRSSKEELEAIESLLDKFERGEK